MFICGLWTFPVLYQTLCVKKTISDFYFDDISEDIVVTVIYYE